MEKTIINAFEKDGVIYPPVEAECENCDYSDSRIVGFNFGGEIIRCYCHHIGEFVDDDQPPCANYSLDLSKISDEQEEEYWRLVETGELEDDEEAEAKKKEIDEFLSL